MRRNRIIKRTVAIVLGLVLSLGLVANVDFTSNATSDKTIAFLTSQNMQGPDTTNGGGWSYVYFGEWNNQPFKYRVLSKNTTEFTSGEKHTMFLDADSLIGEHKFNKDLEGEWKYSDLRKYLNSNNDSFLNTSFDSREKDAIVVSSKDDVFGSLTHVDDKIFSIGIYECVENGSETYGYISNSNRVKKYNNSERKWWLRSGDVVGGQVFRVDEDGNVNYTDSYSNDIYVSPALNISLPSIISFSAVDGTKKGSKGAAYKLTVKDSNMSLTSSAATRNNNKLSVPYTVTGSPTQISYVVTDGSWSDSTGWGTTEPTNVTYKKAKTNSLKSGTAILDLPDDYNPTTMKVYMFAETVNDGNYTDYASAPVEITVSHTHNFTYSSSGATITANCSADNCPLTNHQTSFSIVAPTLTTEGGSGSANATLLGVDEFNTATGFQVSANDIKYAGRAGISYDESATAPTKEGKYTALITVEGKTAELDYEIGKKKEPTPTQHKFLNGDNQVVTYGQPVMFRLEGELSDYNGDGYIEVDEQKVPAKYVAATKGSIILTLASDYVSGLKEGKHDVNIYFNDKSHVSTTFTLQREPSSKTSDTTETTTPTTTPSTTPNTTTKVTAPKTSDSVPFVVVGIVTLTAGIGVVAYRKHKRS